MPLDRRKLLARDPQATLALLRRLDRYLRRFVQDSSRRRELSQSGVVEMLGRLEEEPHATTGQIRRWTAYTAINVLRRELRRLRRKAVAFESQLHSHPGPDPVETLAARDRIERLERLLDKVTERERAALVAKVQGQTDAQIAKQLGTTPAAVRSKVSRIRTSLKLSLSREQRLDALTRLVGEIQHESSSSLGATTS